MKKSLLLFLAILAGTSIMNAADGDIFTDGDYVFEILSEANATVNIKKYNGTSTDIDIPGVATSGSKTYTVEAISNNEDDYKNGAFFNSDIEKVRITYNIKKIGAHSFDTCVQLNEVILGQNVTTIDYAAFQSCRALSKFSIPKTVTNLDPLAFMHCSGLMSFDVEAGNPNYCTINNAIYTIDKSTLFLAPPGISIYTVPDGTRKIAYQAFSRCSNLMAVTLPASVTELEGNAFSFDNKLTTFVIEATTPPTVGDRAFLNLPEGATLYIPEGCWDAYAYANGWRDFKNIDLIGAIKAEEGQNITSGEFIYKVISKEEKTLDCIHYKGYESTVTIPSHVFCNGELYSVKYLGKAPYIGEGNSGKVFEDHSNITSVTMPATVTEIGYNAFKGCSALSYIYMSDQLEIIGDFAFQDCTSLPKPWLAYTLKHIGMQAFSGCSSMQTITIPDNVSRIRSGAFAGCTSLTSVKLPGNLTEIESEVFRDCSSLKNIGIPAGVTNIAFNAFYRCNSLKQFYVPESNTVFATHDGAIVSKDRTKLLFVPGGYTYYTTAETTTTIDVGAFAGCRHLTDVTLNEGLKNIYGSAFYGCSSLAKITIPKTVEVVGDEAFLACPVLESIELPEGVTMIPFRTFKDCIELKSVKFNGPLIGIASEAFYNCHLLGSIELPETMERIGKDAFFKCYSLQTITSLATTPPEVIDSAFTEINHELVTVYVPHGTAEIYRTTPGWDCFSKFVELESGIDEIETPADSNGATAEYFNLNGLRVDSSNLAPGIYIKRLGSTTTKHIVR